MALTYLEIFLTYFRLNGLPSGTEMKNQPYESENFVSEMQSTWENLKPLYEQFHAYVRHKLYNHYVRIQIKDILFSV